MPRLALNMHEQVRVRTACMPPIACQGSCEPVLSLADRVHIAVLVPSSLGVLLNRIKLRLIRSVPVSDDDRHGISNQSRGSIPVV